MLTTTRRIIVLSFFAIIILSYLWSIIFIDDGLMRSLGAIIFSIITGLISMSVLAVVIHKASGDKKKFWMILGTGVTVNTIGNAIYYFTIVNGTYFDVSYVLWLGAYILYLSALVYKAKTLSNSFSNSPFLFNITVFMTTSVTISAHYLMSPIWAVSEHSIGITIIGLFYSITDLGILFLITYLYYLSRFSKERKTILFIITGFLFQIVADSAFLHLSIEGRYQHGGLTDPIWLVGVMFIALAAVNSQDASAKIASEEANLQLENKEMLFPYISVIILVLLVIQSYQWDFNVLSFGLLIVFIMILGRQFAIIKKNRSLVEEYKHLAYHDSLTGLKNRASVHHQLDHYMEEAKATTSSVGLLLIDLDRFKMVNDTLGHHIGDQLLIHAAQRLRRLVHGDDLLYRIGGDEFVVILPDATEQKCVEVSELIIEQFRTSFTIDHHDISISPSIGISFFPRNAKDSQQLMKNADFAMYLAKSNGRNQYCFFHSDLNDALSRKVKIENELRKAIQNQQLVLYYQPIVELKTGQPTKVEALVRWFHPELGTISPVEFIPIAEETGQIIAIGDWVLETACKQSKLWQKDGLPPLTVSINVSVRQFQHADFIPKIKHAIEESGLKPEFLELEITESIMQNVNDSILILDQLKQIGVKTALDDFGTGYSSLHILKKLPINTLKIDKVFIDDITEAGNQPIVKTIIDIGMNLNLEVVAEGIETFEQSNLLAQYQCQLGQGYLYSKPMKAEEVASWVSDPRKFTFTNTE